MLSSYLTAFDKPVSGPGPFRKWALRPLFSFQEGINERIQADIEARLAEAEPEVEVLLAEVVGGGHVRLFIDHPDGVTLDLCERVTQPAARRCASTYALEVSSPGPERPLTKPEHFRRFLGRRARVRTRGAHDGPPQRSPASCVGATRRPR